MPFSFPPGVPCRSSTQIFLVNKSIRDEASPSRNSLVKSDESNNGRTHRRVFLYVVILAQSGVHGDNLRPRKRKPWW